MSRSTPLGGLCIVAGTAIGAAMLALPVAMGRAGFFPSIVAFCAAWGFMAYSSLLFLELCISNKDGSNIISLAGKTVGTSGAFFASSAYLFLLGALLTAYIAALSHMLTSSIGLFTGTAIPKELSSFVLLLLTYVLFTKGVSFVDRMNRIMVLVLAMSFLGLLVTSYQHIEVHQLLTQNWRYVLPSLAIGFTSFGFHVVIPSLAKYLEYDAKTLRWVLLTGSFLPLVAYTIWQGVCLSQIPISGGGFSIEKAYSDGISGAELLSQLSQGPLVSLFSDLFATSAIITSFLGVSWSMVDFVHDGLHKVAALRKHPHLVRLGALLLAFIPPAWFATTSPHIFYTALDVAGIFGVVLLLALFPAWMVYVQRYKKGEQALSEYRAPGGKKTLLGYMFLCVLFITAEMIKMCC